jgi:hypothetical protein
MEVREMIASRKEEHQATLVAAGYFIAKFEHLAPWFKQHKHKLRFQGEKPKLTLV